MRRGLQGVWWVLGMAVSVCGFGTVLGQPFRLPTANVSIYEAGAEGRFFAPTPGRTWESGTFGCVRTDGRQFHEGIDIRSIQKDKAGEPTDPVVASVAGTVAYVNARPGLSNYGNYVVLRHYVEGLEVYTLYAHLRSIDPRVKMGAELKAGEVLGVLGRTTNTKDAIGKDRAHVHFEIDLVANERFVQWHAKTFPGQRNDHSNFNGRNLLGLDPFKLFREQRAQGAEFSLVRFIQSQPELCRVLVRDTSIPYVKRYRALVARNPVAEKEGVAAYELWLNYNGVPLKVIPRAESELREVAKGRYVLLKVNPPEAARHACSRLVGRSGDRWVLRPDAERLLGLLTF